MKKHLLTTIDEKQINIYIDKEITAPIVYANMHTEIGSSIIDECEKLKCAPFHLVSITGLKWDEETSPWACGQVVSRNDNFTGNADSYIDFFINKIIPQAENIILKEHDAANQSCCNRSEPRRIISGYSMGGLLALYSAYITDAFSDVISVSGSLWYPNFISYAKNNAFAKEPASIYFSIGDRECRTRNPYLCNTQSNMEELNVFYKGKNIRSIFEINPGNHFKDVPLRMAKGITWTLGEN